MRRMILPFLIILLTLSMTLVCYAGTDAPVTRAEFASILMAALDGKTIPSRRDETKPPAQFSDLPETDPHYGAVMSAAENGYINGYPDGSFKPNDPVTFEQMVTVMSSALQITADADGRDYLAEYADGGNVSAYAAGYMAENIRRGYIEISNSRVNPKQTITDSEARSYIEAVLSDNIAYGLNIPNETTQLILVTAGGYGVNTGKTRLYSKDANGIWQNIMNYNCYIGKSGFSGDKLLEGRSNTPIGLFTIGAVFGTGNNPGTNMAYRKIQPDDVWVDDPESGLYNTWQKRGENKGRWNSAENMNISAYSIGFVINYNTAERIPYAGSAFFFHVSNSPTQGCVGTSKANVMETVKWLDKDRNPMILMCPADELNTDAFT